MKITAELRAQALTPKQRLMLRLVADHGESAAAESAIDFDDGGALWFVNRDRCIGALKSRGLITDDWELTDAGQKALNQ